MEAKPRPPPPKKAKHNKPLRWLKSREIRIQRGDNNAPSVAYLQVLGAGSRGNAASLFFFTDTNRYLFNCGEGTQRLMQEHKLKASRLDSVFLTRLSWDNVGGLSGLILTLRDTGVPTFVLSGPPHLENYLSAIKTFSGPLEDINLVVRPHTETYTDNTMTVNQVPIFAQPRGDGSPSSSPASSRRDATNSCSPERPGSPGGEKGSQESLVVAYICKLHPKKGHFLVPQAIELGLPVGTPAIQPLIKALKDGRSIQYGGKEIQPEQVCTPAEPGPVFIVLQCPSEDFVEAVCTNQQLRRCQTEDDPPVLVVHMAPESVLNLDQYKDWMERFPSSTEHLIINEHNTTPHHVRSHKIQAQLNMIHPHIFPQLQSYTAKEPQAALRVPTVRAEFLLKFQLRPVMGWQRDDIPSCSTDEFVKEAFEVPNFQEEVDKCKQMYSEEAAETAGESENYPEVIFLGTGSALPMMVRNVSGTLVNISPSQSLLLDCGEGTFGQLCRHYGNGVDEVLSKISTIFISHLHADHHTGLIMLLHQRKRALLSLRRRFTPVDLVAPASILNWLKKYHQSCEQILKHISLIPNKFLCDGATVPKTETVALIHALLKKNDLSKFQTCPVHHCKHAFACSFTHQSGWKIAFSGDTMPCDAFVHIGKNATLLVHEATLEDGLEEEAVVKGHSTTSQAIQVGMKMNADFIMLNHFSQRYAKIPLISPNFSQRVGISFDHMRIRLRDLKVIPQLIPALKTLFAEDIDEMEEKRERRELKSLQLEEVKTATKRGQQEAATHTVNLKRAKSS
ncbi:zinc phosphodiesterase ELAC protein 2 isoform 2-T2 [Aulostomus maculatus]